MAKNKVTTSKKFSSIPKQPVKHAEPVAAQDKVLTAVPPPAAPVAVSTVKAAEVTVAPTVKTAEVVTTPTPALKAVAIPATAVKAADANLSKPAVPTVAATLIIALRDADADVASDAAAALGTLGDKAAVEPLIEVLYNANGYFHSVVRAAAASSLGELKDIRAIDPLLFAMDDTMAEASAEAVRALATLGDRRIVGTLADVVRNRTGFYLQIVRLAATLAMAKLGGDEATRELQLIAENSREDQIIRDAAGQHAASPIKAHR